MLLVAAVLAVVGLGWLIPTAWKQANPTVTGEVIIFDIDSPTHATFTLEVRRSDPSRAARCEVIAIAENYERVGEVAFTVPPSEHTTMKLHHELRTFREATTVQLYDCNLA